MYRAVVSTGRRCNTCCVPVKPRALPPISRYHVIAAAHHPRPPPATITSVKASNGRPQDCQDCNTRESLIFSLSPRLFVCNPGIGGSTNHLGCCPKVPTSYHPTPTIHHPTCAWPFFNPAITSAGSCDSDTTAFPINQGCRYAYRYGIPPLHLSPLRSVNQIRSTSNSFSTPPPHTDPFLPFPRFHFSTWM